MPYEDPNPPPVEEKTAAPAKGGKAPAGKPAEDSKPEIRMITPDPVLMTNENGRLFEIELGRLEKINKKGTESVEQLPAEGTQHTEEAEEHWVNYKFNQQLNLLVRLNPIILLFRNNKYPLSKEF